MKMDPDVLDVRRFVAMLARMMDAWNQVREPETVYGYEYVYEYGVEGAPNKPLKPTRRTAPRG